MIKKILLNGVATSINILTGLLRNKIFAAFLTINVFGILSIGQQSAGVIFTFFALGLPMGITTLSAQIITESPEEQKKTLSSLIVITMLVASLILVLLSAFIFINPEYISRIVTNRTDFALPISIILFSVPLMIIQTCLHSIMVGRGMLKEIIIFKLLPSVVILPALYWLTSSYNLIGASIAISANEAFLAFVGFVLLRKHFHLSMEVFNVRPVFLRVFKIAVLSFIAGVTWLVSDFQVKRTILGHLGEIDNAIVQSVAKVTDLYPNIALAWLTMHMFPEISKRKDDPMAAAALIERTALIAMALMVPIIIVMFLGRSLILDIIYKHEFRIASEYFGAMLTTGVPKAYSWVMGAALLPLGFRKDWFYSIILFNFLYVAGSWVAFLNHSPIYFLPVVTGIGLVAESIFRTNVYRRRGLILSTDFALQSMWYAVMAIFLVLSIYWLPCLVIVMCVYSYVNYRYHTFDNFLAKIYDRYRRV
jgi:O-antigen/teichoic acid export membrane protein